MPWESTSKPRDGCGRPDRHKDRNAAHAHLTIIVFGREILNGYPDAAWSRIDQAKKGLSDPGIDTGSSSLSRDKHQYKNQIPAEDQQARIESSCRRNGTDRTSVFPLRSSSVQALPILFGLQPVFWRNYSSQSPPPEFANENDCVRQYQSHCGIARSGHHTLQVFFVLSNSKGNQTGVFPLYRYPAARPSAEETIEGRV